MNNLIKLRTLTVTADSGGFPSEAVSTVEVYADTKSVRQTEYYAADANGKRLDTVLVINADEWNGATEAELNGVVYEIVRAYQVGLGRVELTCARR
jgi:SPP1 family predicted phage head-tail adaptor